MEDKIQLRHPEGKKAIKIAREKFDIMSKAISYCLNARPSLTHTELTKSVNDYLRKNKIKFDGSVEWYMELVKLDMEAGKTIERFKDKSKLMFRLA